MNHNGSITVDEYTKVLSLTDYEIDLAIEKIRLKLLTPCIPKDSSNNKQPKITQSLAATTMGVIGALSLAPHPHIGKHKIRESRTLSQVFKLMNVKADDILSLDEIMDLASRVEVFVTEEEARKILQTMDVNGDDRVDELDFIAMMKKETSCIVNKAYRIRETAALLRRWLVRGTSEKNGNNSSAIASKEQWKAFKLKYVKSSGQKFPGYLSAYTLQVTVATLGIWISAIEARELSLVVAPEKNGRVHLTELHSFMGRHCRGFGELVALLQREVLTDLVEAYRACYQSKKATGKDDVDLTMLYRKQLDELKKAVENVYDQPSVAAIANASGGEGDVDTSINLALEEEEDDDEEHSRPAPLPVPDPKFKKTSHEVISIAQLKNGLQIAVNAKKIPEHTFPNLEEWACLAILVDADVAEGDVYGVKLRAFLEGITRYIVTVDDSNRMKSGEKVSLEIVSRELKRQIFFEARSHSRNRKPDYQSIFDLFDENHNGSLSLAEFKGMLKKLQLVNALPDHQMPQLLALFDRNKRGVVTYEDFASFADEAKYSINQGDFDDDEEDPFTAGARRAAIEGSIDGEEDEEMYDDLDLASPIPPISVTKNADCDWLAWYIYRQSCHIDSLDPESIITELEARSAETEMTQNKSYITVKDFWNILFELGLQASLTKQQYTKGALFLCTVGHGHDEDRIDYQALCKYAIRMGRAFVTQQQEKQKEVEKNFQPLLVELKRYFKQLCEDER